MKLRSTLILFVTIFLCQSASTQDRFFTQFYANPLEFNPALTGAFFGSYRVTAGYRDQWNGFVNSPYLTIANYGDFRFDASGKNSSSKNFFGVGIGFVSDRTAFFNYNTNQITISAAFHKDINSDKRSFFSGGFSYGIVQRNLNIENLQFGDQFNGLNGYTFGTNEIFPENNFAHGDLSIGLNYTISPSKYSSFYLGGAIQHLIEPNISFYDNTEDLSEFYENTPLYRKYIFAASAEIGFSESYAILPRLIFQSQGPASMLNIGSTLKFDLTNYNRNAFQVGGGMRLVQNQNSSLYPAVAYVQAGFILENLLIGFSYDLNLDDLGNERLGQNAFEISISFIGEYDNANAFCPTF